MTTETLPSIDYPHVGSFQSWRSPLGTCTITVTRGEFTFTVETLTGPHRDEMRCGAYASEREARGNARMWAELAKAADDSKDKSKDKSKIVSTKGVTLMPVPAYARCGTLTSTTPVAKGNQLAMTLAQATAIYEVGGFGGFIHRGRPDAWGCATTSTLTAMGKRGFGSVMTESCGRRKVVTGLTVGILGARIAAEVLSNNGRKEAADLVAESIPEDK